MFLFVVVRVCNVFSLDCTCVAFTHYIRCSAARWLCLVADMSIDISRGWTRTMRRQATGQCVLLDSVLYIVRCDL